MTESNILKPLPQTGFFHSLLRNPVWHPSGLGKYAGGVARILEPGTPELISMMHPLPAARLWAFASPPFFKIIYLCGCIGSQLPHVASSLWCKGFCLIVACGLLGSVVAMHWLSCPTRCGILVPWPGIEPMSLALEGEFSTREPPGKSPCFPSMTLTSHAHKRGSQHLCPRAGWGCNEVMKVLQPAQGQGMAAAYCPCVLSSCL